MLEPLILRAAAEDAEKRLDSFLSGQLPEVSRSALQKWIAEGCVLVNGKPAAKNLRLREGDTAQVVPPEPTESAAAPEPVSLDIVYEDADLLVVNKPKGMVVHPAPGNPNGTLVNALLYHCRGGLSGVGGVIRPGIVHRIDKATSGLLIVAKNDRAHRGLSAQIKEHSFLREYEAVVYGAVKAESGRVDGPIARSRTDRKKMCVAPADSGAKPAVTHYEVLCRYVGFTHIRCRLETGRTHQIRVHMAALGHPVAGDEVYGPKRAIRALGGQCLHAKTIAFVHPITGERLSFTSELPDYFTDFLKTLKPLS